MDGLRGRGSSGVWHHGGRAGAPPHLTLWIGTVVVVVVVVVFTLKTVLTSIQYPSLSYSSRQRNEFPWSHANPK